MRRKSSKKSKKLSTYLLIAIIVAMGGYLLIKSMFASLFLRPIERINFVVLERSPIFYSLDTRSGVDYVVPFVPDLKVTVPGGYGDYRFGALRKLISLEKNPDILRRAFSAGTATFTPFYFYPPRVEVSYGDLQPPAITGPTVRQLFFYDSNAGFFDKVYIYLELLKRKRGSFSLIDEYKKLNHNGTDTFDEEAFAKKFQGFFYHKSYREEKRTVQIIYTNYAVAVLIGRIIEGSGIRVVDLSAEKADKTCIVTEEGNAFSRSARDIVRFFGCHLEHGNTPISDIIIKLGSRVEGEWEVK